MQIPKDIEKNLAFRDKLVRWAVQSVDNAAMLHALCKKDILFYFNAFLFAEDPFAEKGRRHGVPRRRIRPIVTYPEQDKVIQLVARCMRDGEDVIGDKSRDMLATYIVLGCGLHGFLFEGYKGIVSSWLEDEIDKKDDTSTHFGKMRFMLKKHPKFLLPSGFVPELGTDYCTRMTLINPENGATIVGKAASSNLGSGRREDWAFLDELSKWQEHAETAWDGLTDTTPCKIGVWTPKGSGNKAAQLMRGDDVKNKFHLLWYKHPEKCYTSEKHLELVKSGKIVDKLGNYTVSISDGYECPDGCYCDQYGKIRSQWYDEECSRRSVDDIRENLDCDYITSGNQVFDAIKCESNRRKAKPPLFVGNLNWKTPPEFDKNGNISNMKYLAVEWYDSFNGKIAVWEKPISGWDEYSYLIPADVAEGLEQGDFDSAGVVKRIGDKPEVVANVFGKMPIHEYADTLVMLAVWYNNCIIAPENNGKMGGAIVEQMFRIWNRIYHSEIFSKGYAERTDKLGWSTNSGTKPTIIANLGKMIANDEFIDNDERFWNQTLTFVNNNGKLEAQGKSQGEKCYDDIVMRNAIGMWITEQLPLPRRIIKIEPLKGFRANLIQNNDTRVGWML